MTSPEKARPERLDLREVSRLLDTEIVGRTMACEEEMLSTNQFLLDAVAGGEAVPGLVALCESQSAGRGRQRRLWHSPPGKNLYLSVLWKSRQPAQRLPQLAMLAALALHQAMKQCLPELRVGLKWPNDLWDGKGRKLSGILCECPPTNRADAAERWAVIGIGVNVNAQPEDFPPELSRTAASLAIDCGHAISREKLLALLLNSLDGLLAEWEASAGFGGFVERWNRHDILKGRRITVDLPGNTALSATVLGVTPEGLLQVASGSGGKPLVVSAGDVHLHLDAGDAAHPAFSPSSD